MAGAHANKLGQAQFEGVISEYVKEMTATEQAGFDAEMKKLGDKSDTRLQAVANFLGANLPPEQVAALRAAATSADAIMGLEALMNRNANPQPRNDPPAPVTRKTRDEITALMATSAYSGRPNERNPAIVSEVDKWFEDQAALDAKGTK